MSSRKPAFQRSYLRSVLLLRDKVKSFEEYPFSIPAVRHLTKLEFDPRVTFLVGENGTGKSTLIEAIAVATGFNPERGSRNFNFTTRPSESDLHRCLRLARGVRRPKDGFFLRAESYFNVGTEIERLDSEGGGGLPIIDAYGGVSVHDQSHGESFIALATHRFRGGGLYILDEPEAALSPGRQLAFLKIIDDHVRRRESQFVIATHSPIIMSYPSSLIYRLAPEGIEKVAYEETEHFLITRDFLTSRETFFRHLFADEPPGGSSPEPD